MWKSNERGRFTEEARRSQLVECATAALAEPGYAQMSLAEIARRAEVKRAPPSRW
jgi:AcrR family transcriptional regulator